MMRAGALAMILLAATAPSLGAEAVDLCGEVFVYRDPPCAQFATFTRWGYWVPIVRPLGPDDVIRLVAETAPCSEDCGSPLDSCLVDYTVLPCPRQDLGCGVIRGRPDPVTPCCVWESPIYGRVESEVCPAEGDTVHVFGHLDYTFITVCMLARTRLVSPIMTSCADTTTAAAPASWGRLKAWYR